MCVPATDEHFECVLRVLMQVGAKSAHLRTQRSNRLCRVLHVEFEFATEALTHVAIESNRLHAMYLKTCVVTLRQYPPYTSWPDKRPIT